MTEGCVRMVQGINENNKTGASLRISSEPPLSFAMVMDRLTDKVGQVDP